MLVNKTRMPQKKKIQLAFYRYGMSCKANEPRTVMSLPGGGGGGCAFLKVAGAPPPPNLYFGILKILFLEHHVASRQDNGVKRNNKFHIILF